MKGHIRKRSKDSWSVVIDIGRDLATGKRCQKWHTAKGTKRDAHRALREILSSLDKGIYVEPTNITLGEWLEKWLDNYIAKSMLENEFVESQLTATAIEHHSIKEVGSEERSKP